MAFGTYILWIAWFFFNGSSTISMFYPRKNNTPKIIMNTTLAGSVGGIVATFAKPIVFKTWNVAKFDVGTLSNGILAGLVGITAPCNNVTPTDSIWIGIIAGIFYVLFCKVLEKFDIDDPVEATCVHLAGGMWGVFSTGLFDNTKGLFYCKDLSVSFPFFGY